MPKNERNPQRRRQAILAAAGEILVDRGLGGFGINAIAERAGCGKPLVYRYFGTKRDVLDALTRLKAEEVSRTVAAVKVPESTRMTKIVFRQIMFARLLAADALLRALFRAMLAGEIGVGAADALESAIPRHGAAGDAGAAEAFLMAGISYVLLVRDSRRECLGVAIATPADLASFERAFVQLSSR